VTAQKNIFFYLKKIFFLSPKKPFPGLPLKFSSLPQKNRTAQMLGAAQPPQPPGSYAYEGVHLYSVMSPGKMIFAVLEL